MKIEDQVCSLPLAKRLVELGLDEGAVMLYILVANEVALVIHTDEDNFIYFKEQPSAHYCYGKDREHYPAFSVAELGVMLPSHFPSFVHDDLSSAHCINYRVDGFPLSDEDANMVDNPTPNHILNKELVPLQAGETEANARAYMLIYLIENNYITIEEVNKRLNKKR